MILKRVDRYILSSVLRVGLITLLMTSIIMVLVQLFMEISDYIRLSLPFTQILYICIMNLPDAIVLTIGPSMLFSTTYFISMLYANNELITFLNAGLPYRRIIRPIITLALILMLSVFAFNELVAIPVGKFRDDYTNELFSRSSTNTDSRNTTLMDIRGGYSVSVSRFSGSSQTITGVIIAFQGENGALTKRVNADRGVWDAESGTWRLMNATVYEISGDEVSHTTYPEYTEPNFTAGPDMFRNLSSDMETMEFSMAVDYLREMKSLSANQYADSATTFWERVLTCSTVFIMMVISCSVNLKFKKNVLLFSILTSLGVAVVYYVVQMVTLIMARQGVISPIMGMGFPILFILAVSGLSASLIRT